MILSDCLLIRVVNNESILTASKILNARGGWGWGWKGGKIEIRAKFPNGHCLKSYVWLDSRDSNLKNRGWEYIDFVSFQEFNPNLIRSGLNFGKKT